MPRLQCHQKQQKSTGTLRSMQEANLRMPQKYSAWSRKIGSERRSDQRGVGRRGTERRAEEEEKQRSHSSSARDRSSSTRTNGRIGSARIERRSH